QDFLLHGNLADQLRLIHAAVLAQDVTVEYRANRRLHLQDPCVKLIAGDAVSAIRYGKGMAIVRSRDARPVGLAVCAIDRTAFGYSSVPGTVGAISTEIIGR